MWLKLRTPVIIYDSRARTALRARNDDLEDYYVKWRSRYSDAATPIAAACATLPDVVEYSVDPSAPQGYVAELANSPWFQERVLDMYLWRTGAPTEDA
jgi:hypothetical protein